MNKTDSFNLLSCGVKRHPPRLVIKYSTFGKTKLHFVNLRDIDNDKPVTEYITGICEKAHHKPFLRSVPKIQLIRMVSILRDLVAGIPLEDALHRNAQIERISSTEDLNKAEDEVVAR